MVDLDKYVALFLTDSREHLQQCNTQLLEWERTPAAPAPVAALFRSIHTIKGMAATLGYTRLAELSHALENLLGEVRDGKLIAEPRVLDLCFRGIDALEAGIEPATQGRDGDLPVRALLDQIQSTLQREGAAAVVPLGQTGEFAVPVVPDGGRPVRVVLRRDAEMLGARASIVLLKAELLGKVGSVFPPPEAFQTDGFSGEISFRLTTAASDERIAQVIREAGDIQSVVVGDRPAAGAKRPAKRQVRVALDRLDDLLNQVSELVVAKNRLVTLAGEAPGTPLEATTHQIARLVTAVQMSVADARLAPVAEVFDRFPRPIRDLARQLNKRAALVIEGGDIALDRSILDELGDPLLHLLRNALDHGLEAADARVQAGKPAEGTLLLRAARERDAVVITVQDDGKGIDRKAVAAKARRLGLLGTDDALDDDDALLQLIGRPGFTTTRTVTGVSGRGVGIDVVLTRFRALGGRVTLRTVPGHGTAFELRIPLTLAVIQALLVGVGDERYAVPISSVVETGQVDAQAAEPEIATGRLTFRGQSLPVYPMGTLVEVGALRAPLRKRPLVVVETGRRRAALLVDTLLGRQDIVVEPVDAPRGMPAWLNGAAILGDGIPILVLDPAALL